MQQKKSINFGFRGWMLLIYQFIAYIAMTAYTNYPLNILADMYGGAQKISMIFTGCTIIGVIMQLILSSYIGKMKSIKLFGTLLGAAALILGVAVMLISPAHVTLWQVCYGLEIVCVTVYATFAIGILIGQWFPRRKGTVMGIATLAFPVGNALIGPFAARVFADGQPNVVNGFLPFIIAAFIGWLIGVIFIKDYPEQCGAYRDNDKSLTPEIAKAMMEEEIENKRTTVWKLGHTFGCADFWLGTIPLGFLLMFSVGAMTQTSAIIEASGMPLPFAAIMLLVCIFGCIGSYVLGLLDTKLGTKKSVIMATVLMILAGILGTIPNGVTALAALLCLSLFMGASSNYMVSIAAQYWRREDFPSVFGVVNPIANIIQSIGPMIIASLLFSSMGYQGVFLVCGIFGVISLIMILAFSPARVKAKDDRYRAAAGKPLDDTLVGRK